MEQCTALDVVRKYKIVDMAVFDWAATLLGAYLVNYFYLPKMKYWKVALVFVLLGIVVHKMMGINTMLNYYLGLSGMPIRKHC